MKDQQIFNLLENDDLFMQYVFIFMKTNILHPYVVEELKNIGFKITDETFINHFFKGYLTGYLLTPVDADSTGRRYYYVALCDSISNELIEFYTKVLETQQGNHSGRHNLKYFMYDYSVALEAFDEISELARTFLIETDFDPDDVVTEKSWGGIMFNFSGNNGSTSFEDRL